MRDTKVTLASAAQDRKHKIAAFIKMVAYNGKTKVVLNGSKYEVYLAKQMLQIASKGSSRKCSLAHFTLQL